MPPTASASVTLPDDRRPASRAAVAWRVGLAVYALALLTGTHLPSTHPVVSPLVGVDKPLHFAGYFGLAMLMFRAARAGAPAVGTTTRLALAAVALVVGAADELTQPLVNRSCDIADWWSDAAGIALAVLVDAHLLVARRPT